MVVRREKKRKSLRGWRTHGWGRVGQHRRSGSRGGRGRAGYHKHYWSWVVKYAPDWFGKRGFTRPPRIQPRLKCINVGELCERIEEWVSAGLAKRLDGGYEVDLTKLGYEKLLGRGRVDKPLTVKIYTVSKIAVKKIEAIGGKVIAMMEEE